MIFIYTNAKDATNHGLQKTKNLQLVPNAGLLIGTRKEQDRLNTN